MKAKFNIVSGRKIWFTFSGILVVASVVLFLTIGLKLGLDFTGGSLMTLRFDKEITQTELTDFSKNLLGDVQLNALTEANTWNLKAKNLSSDENKLFLQKAEAQFGSVEQASLITIGSVVSQSLRNKALIALLIALVGMIATITYEFRKLPSPLVSWKFGVAAVGALFHDIMITVGFFVVFGKMFDISVDTFFVTALLTILGYSISDTIVIFDKIRENTFRMKAPFSEIVEVSLWETMRRSINTTSTILIALFSLLIFGPEALHTFVLALIIGTFFGAYSSIFIAAPVLVVWHKQLNSSKK